MEHIRNLIGTGRVKSYDKQTFKSSGMLIVQAEINGSVEDVIIFNHWGDSGIPYLGGAECVAFAILGYSELKFGFIKNQRYAPKTLVDGEKMIYNKDVKILLDKDGNLNITTKKDCVINSSGKTTINSTGNITINSSGVVNVSGTMVNIGDAASFALNSGAVINDSLGFPCTIVSAGNTKVKI